MARFSCTLLLLLGASFLRGSVLNAAPSPPDNAKRLLVVAPDQLRPALKEFIRFKQKLLPTDLVSLEKILRTSSGVDDPEKLKRFLYNRWRHHNLGYVLLVGDVDVMPVRYMVLDRVTPAAYDYAFYPSDLYYSDLAKPDGSFDDWNARKESFHAGYFGEVRGEKNKHDAINYDAVDYRPEIAVGRWPVSTPEEVRRAAAKTIAHEKEIRDGTAPWERRAALLAVGGWVDSRDLLDELGTKLSRNWQVEKCYYSDPHRRSETLPPTHENVRALFQGGVGLVVHTGHGASDAWAYCFSERDLEALTNGADLPVVMSAGCSTAYFAPLAPYDSYVDVSGKEHAGTDHGETFRAPPPPPCPYQRGRFNPTGLGEQLLKHSTGGAVAYIGCDTGSQPCALTLVQGFVTAISTAEQPRLGDCWMQAVRTYYDQEHLAALKPNDDWYPPSIFFQGMKFMVFGDPSLRLR